MKKNLYSCTAVSDLINTLVNDYGYDAVTLQEGVLGYGYMVLVSPSENMYNYIIQEVPLNCWNSAHKVRRAATLSKKFLKELSEIGYC